MIIIQGERLLSWRSPPWMHAKCFSLPVSPLFLSVSLQFVTSMTEMKQAPRLDEMMEFTEAAKGSSSAVSDFLLKEVSDQEETAGETVQSPGLSCATLPVHEFPDISRGRAVLLEGGDGDVKDSSALSDLVIARPGRPVSDAEFLSELKESPLDGGHVGKGAGKVALEASSVPLYCSSPEEPLAPSTQQAVSASFQGDKLSTSFNNGIENISIPSTLISAPKTQHWHLRRQVKGHAPASQLDVKSDVHSCPDLYVNEHRIHSTDIDYVGFAALKDWSALDSKEPAVQEGIDEITVRTQQRKPEDQCSSAYRYGNISDPCLTSFRENVLSDENIWNLSGTSYKSMIEPRNNKSEISHYTSSQEDDAVEQSRSDYQDVFQPSSRRRSTSVVFVEYDRDQHEHIEESSVLQTQRKRKFRRRRSLSLPIRTHSGKGKSGKTKKLCKRKKSSVQSHTSSVFPVDSVSTTKQGETFGESFRAAGEKTLMYASSLLGRCTTDSGADTSVPVSSGNMAASSISSASYPAASARSLYKRSFQYPGDGKHCLHIRRRSSVDRVKGIVVDGGEFTVVPVNNEVNLLEQTAAAAAAASGALSSSNSLRVPHQSLDIDGEPSDTLTQNSITSLLSAKFRDVAKRWKQYGVDSPRFRKRLHSKWESMNYEVLDSQLQRKHNEENKSKKKLALNRLSSWIIYFFIGIGTAFMAAGVQISVEVIANQKFGLIRDFLDECSKEDCLIQPVLIWISLNGSITFLAAVLVTYVQPMAAGSGIPLIKSYLNGIRVPGLLSVQAFIAKCLGVVLSILGGLACGKEGPMAHSGSIVAAGLGKGRIPWFKKNISLYGLFRTDHNIRDLVAAGAACGVSAAFGAPVGGTLFSVEEAASFWNTELVWKVFFSAMIACFSTNVLLSAFEGHPTQLSNPGLVRFNTFPNLTFDLIEIPVFIFMAAIGGLIGALFVVMNYKLTIFRQKYLHHNKWVKVVEAVLVAVTGAVVAFVLMFVVKDCTNAHPYTHHAITTRLGCSGDSYNSMSALFLTTPEGCLKSLLHDPLESYSVVTLVLFTVIFFLLGVWTYGLSVSSGVFIPSLAIGAAWGRLIGMGVVQLFPDQAKDVGKYALIGAASQLGGILRTTISLTVIIVECTGDITFGLCIMISLMISKWVGDFFTTGIYDMNIEVSGIPLLSWEPPPLCEHIYVSDLMSQPVMTLLQVEKVGHIYDCLIGETFNCFPIIEQDLNCDFMYKGKLKGIILRHQILVLLNKRVFCPEGQMPINKIVLKDFENSLSISQSLKIEDIELSDVDKECVMDLTPYMNQSPYTVSLNFSMSRVFRLFRGLGLRHLVVVDDNFEPIGMVTRKDLAKYRAEIKKGMLHMEHLTVENR